MKQDLLKEMETGSKNALLKKRIITHYILKALLNAYFRKKIQLCFSSLWTLTIIIQLSRHKYRYIYYLCNT